MNRFLTLFLLAIGIASAGAQSITSSAASNQLAADYKLNVIAASTANIDLTEIVWNSTVIDGVTITAAGQRFLAKDQSTSSQNGIYISSASGEAARRATDADTWAELPGSMVVVTTGGTNANKIYVNSSATTGTLGSTAISWVDASPGTDFNGTVGATTPASGAFTTLTASGTATIQGITGIGGTPNQNNLAGDPDHIFDIVNNNTALQVFSMHTYGGTGATPYQNNMHFYRMGGTAASPTQTLNNMYFMSMGFRGRDNSPAVTQSSCAIQVQATEDFTATGHGTKFVVATTPNGSTTRSTILTVTGAGADVVGAITATGNIQLKSDSATGLQFTGADGTANDMTIYYDRGASTLYFRDNAVPSNRLSITQSGAATFSGPIITTPQALSGAGAVNLTTGSTAFTSTGAAQALTLADGTNGQVKTLVHVSDGGSGVLTPTTKSGYTTITFTNVGDSVTLQFFTTAGWCIVGIYGAVAA